MLLGHVPGVEFFHNFFPKKDDLYWTPADWAWIGGLIDVLLPSWHHGVPVVAYRAKKFDPEQAFYFIAKYGIRNAFMPPTALKIMRQVKEPKKRHDYKMRTIGCGGETLGEELLGWGREVMDLVINEFYGQTECNLVVGNCAEIMEVRRGSMGRAIPGHRVEVIDDSGIIVPPGRVGRGCYSETGPGDVSGVLGEIRRQPRINLSATGYARAIWPKRMRPDTSGLSEGKTMSSPAPDTGSGLQRLRIACSSIPPWVWWLSSEARIPVRTEIVKAFIVLKPEMAPSPSLKEDIQNFVKTRLAAHEYPREIEFVKELPLTATGKIMRKELRKMEVERKTKGET